MEKELKTVMEKFPRLNSFGMGLYANGNGLIRSEKIQQMKQNKESLLSRTEAICKIIEWLSRINKIKTINTKHTSYRYKHIVENDIGYITNGEFIAAAIIAGFKPAFTTHGPNASFNMSAKDWLREERRIRAAWRMII